MQYGVARCYIMQIWFSRFSLGSDVVKFGFVFVFVCVCVCVCVY